MAHEFLSQTLDTVDKKQSVPGLNSYQKFTGCLSAPGTRNRCTDPQGTQRTSFSRAYSLKPILYTYTLHSIEITDGTFVSRQVLNWPKCRLMHNDEFVTEWYNEVPTSWSLIVINCDKGQSSFSPSYKQRSRL